MKKLLLVVSALVMFACGSQTQERTDRDDPPSEIDKIHERLRVLELLSGSLGTLVESEFKSCADLGALQGKDLAKKICQIAQAATIETQAELLSKIQAFNQQLIDKINALSGDVATNATAIDNILTEIDSLESSITSLENRMTDAEGDILDAQNAIDALEDSLQDVIDNLDTAMTYVEVGSENLSAGPLYESLLRRVNKSVIVGFTEAYGASRTITGCTATSGSPNVTCTTNIAHGYSAGTNVYIVGVTGGRGLTASDLTGDFVLVAGTTGSTIVFTVGKNATQSGNLGGSQGSAKEVLGRAMRKIWETSDGADAAVRVTSLGNKRYNFIVEADGDVCYDSTNHAATFATISALGGNIVCK